MVKIIRWSKAEFRQFWGKYDPDDNLFMVNMRIDYWNKNFKDVFNLVYDETDNEEDWAFYGSVEGDPKDITWFQLHL